jgi:hypothetical protein
MEGAGKGGSPAAVHPIWGCFLDLVNALACIGTAVALFPVVKRQNEAVALGFVTSWIGLIGAPLLIASAIAALFRGNDDLFSLVEGAAPSRQAH